jgi:hypothetical protein
MYNDGRRPVGGLRERDTHKVTKILLKEILKCTKY